MNFVTTAVQTAVEARGVGFGQLDALRVAIGIETFYSCVVTEQSTLLLLRSVHHQSIDFRLLRVL